MDEDSCSDLGYHEPSSGLSQRIFKVCQNIMENEGIHNNIGKPVLNRIMTKMKPVMYIIAIVLALLFASNGIIMYGLYTMIKTKTV